MQSGDNRTIKTQVTDKGIFDAHIAWLDGDDNRVSKRIYTGCIHSTDRKDKFTVHLDYSNKSYWDVYRTLMAKFKELTK